MLGKVSKHNNRLGYSGLILKQITLFIAIVNALFLLCNTSQASSNHRARGLFKFQKEKYDQAIIQFRKYLRKNPDDYNTWNLLAASYYHTGLPLKALSFLKKIKGKVRQKSYNQYYQGLCLDALGRTKKAKKAFARAAKYSDEYAARSLFELAIIDYNLQNKKNALYWLRQYLRRFPNGVFRSKVLLMIRSLNQGNYMLSIESSKKPDFEKALFKYNKWSLSKRPHYWFVDSGYAIERGTNNNPGMDRNNAAFVKKEVYEDHNLLISTGIGIGPIKKNKFKMIAGYHYHQNWGADQDRIQTYLDDPTDLEYFAFRPDLLERHHIIHGYLSYNINPRFSTELLISYDIAKLGTSIFSGPEDHNLKRVLDVSKTSLIIPSFTYNYKKFYKTTGYLFIKKEVNEEAPEYSNQSYNLFDSKMDPHMSFGIDQELLFPKQNIKLGLDLFYYQIIYNDYWLDHTRRGLLISAEYKFLNDYTVSGQAGMYEDDFDIPLIKSNSCKFTPDSSSSNQERSLVTLKCSRKDQGMFYKLGFSWLITRFNQLSGYFIYRENINPDLKIFDKSINQFVVSYTFAFPGIERVSPFLKKFGDNKSNKRVE